MAFFRQYIIPIFVLLGFLLALVAVSARIFLPSDLAAPAPIEEYDAAAETSAGVSQSQAPSLPTSAGSVVN